MYITNSYDIFTQGIVDAAIEHAKEMFPLESCGAVIDNQYIRFKNCAQKPEEHFLINDPAFSLAHLSGKVKAVIHSHNDCPRASKEDQRQQQALDVPFGIINLRNRSVLHVVFFGDSLPKEPLEGRTFFYGVWDCYDLVREFIRQRFNLVAPNPPRNFAFWKRAESVFEQFIKDGILPFKRVELEDVRPDDILFYTIHGTKYINHCGVMRENGLVLHHLYNQISKTYPAENHWEYRHSAYRYDPVGFAWKDNAEEWRMST